jgi:hypothetical protein
MAKAGADARINAEARIENEIFMLTCGLSFDGKAPFFERLPIRRAHTMGS